MRLSLLDICTNTTNYSFLSDSTTNYHTGATRIHADLSVMLTEAYVRTTSRKRWPETLLIIEDAASDHRNLFRLLMFALMVRWGWFSCVQFIFLPSGHTHWKIDQVFSRISRLLGRKFNGTMSIDELKTIIEKAWKTAKIDQAPVIDLNDIPDWKMWLTRVQQYCHFQVETPVQSRRRFMIRRGVTNDTVVIRSFESSLTTEEYNRTYDGTSDLDADPVWGVFGREVRFGLREHEFDDYPAAKEMAEKFADGLGSVSSEEVLDKLPSLDTVLADGNVQYHRVRCQPRHPIDIDELNKTLGLFGIVPDQERYKNEWKPHLDQWAALSSGKCKKCDAFKNALSANTLSARTRREEGGRAILNRKRDERMQTKEAWNDHFAKCGKRVRNTYDVRDLLQKLDAAITKCRRLAESDDEKEQAPIDACSLDLAELLEDEEIAELNNTNRMFGTSELLRRRSRFLGMDRASFARAGDTFGQMCVLDSLRVKLPRAPFTQSELTALRREGVCSSMDGSRK